MSLVLDSSVTMARVYADETTDAVREVFERLSQSGAWVPSFWRLEIANALAMGIRRNRHDRAFLEKTLADLAYLPIHIDPETGRQAWGATVRLADRHRLTIYDAAYLELALRRNLPLATLDRQLREAAASAGIGLLGA
jgi:predicted nucleic acid-binding protein